MRRRFAAFAIALICSFTFAFAFGRFFFGAYDTSSASAIAAWNETTAPNYYEVVGNATFEELPVVGTAVYAPLDQLGRAGKVCACVDHALMEEGASRERKNMQDLHPSGWGHNEKVAIELPNGKTYHGYFWNRSHLLAKSLGGDETLENLVCGTRMQNVGANTNGAKGGMAYTEERARTWLEQNPSGYLYYSAEPVYKDDEPVCRHVIVNLRTSDGSIDERVVVYNAAKGFTIDYSSGQFSVDEPSTTQPSS